MKPGMLENEDTKTLKPELRAIISKLYTRRSHAQSNSSSLSSNTNKTLSPNKTLDPEAATPYNLNPTPGFLGFGFRSRTSVRGNKN